MPPRTDPDRPFHASGSGLRPNGPSLVGPRVEDADARPVKRSPSLHRLPRGTMLWGLSAQGPPEPTLHHMDQGSEIAGNFPGLRSSGARRGGLGLAIGRAHADPQAIAGGEPPADTGSGTHPAFGPAGAPTGTVPSGSPGRNASGPENRTAPAGLDPVASGLEPPSGRPPAAGSGCHSSPKRARLRFRSAWYDSTSRRYGRPPTQSSA